MATYIRTNKATARRIFNSGHDIIAIPCKLNPANQFFAMGAVLNVSFIESFENACNSLTYYNCSSETGRYLSFYIES